MTYVVLTNVVSKLRKLGVWRVRAWKVLIPRNVLNCSICNGDVLMTKLASFWPLNIEASTSLKVYCPNPAVVTCPSAQNTTVTE